jgi:dTDP-4-amino-4,6-dideoxygalactose transaminase
MPDATPTPLTRAIETLPDLPLFDLRLDEGDIEAVLDALRSGWLTMGPRTEAFERAFAAHLGVRHAVAVSSCTAALHLAYLAAGVSAGDEVIVPAMTFAATAAAVVYCGGRPVFADILGPHDLSLDPTDVERKLTARTKAVCVVHFGGYAAPVRELSELCAERGIALIEDAAHAPAAEAEGRKLGTWGLAGAFSFFSNKVLACGEGGLVATDDDEVARLARSLRNQGMTADSWSRYRGLTDGYDADAIGFNYRLDEPRAALLLSRLHGLEAAIARRRQLTRTYRQKLAALPSVSVPFSDESVGRSSCYVMPILVSDSSRRDEARRNLRQHHGVQTSLFYPAVHELGVYRERYGAVGLPHSEHVARAEITLPLFPEMDEPDQDRVVAALAAELASDAGEGRL